MLTHVPTAERERLRPLFAGLPGLHGVLDAALEGTMGRAWADDVPRSAVAVVHLEFHLLGGDPRSAAAEEAVRSLPAGASIVTSSAAWAPVLGKMWGDRLGEYTRVAFRAGPWDHGRLRGLIDGLPAGFTLKRIAAGDAARFAELADSLVYNFPSLDDFLARGAGFGIEHDGRFVSGCSSFAISSRRLEFEIQTHADYRRRGLATAAAAAMIGHCLERGLEPCWDAHNEQSAALAGKLGFLEPRPYTAYEVEEEHRER